MRPDRSRPGRRALLGSVLLHAGFFALLFSGVVFAQSMPNVNFKAFRVELVAAPPPAPVEKETPVAQKEPESKPAPTPPPKTPEPKPKAKTEQPKPQPSTEKAKPKEQAATEPRPDTTAGTGKDALDVSIKGEESEFSDYYANVITQINRYFRWTGTSHPVAEVYFIINRDGSVGDIRLVRRSGNPAFDFEAIGAIEQAGKRRAFGPLPKGFTGDNLPVSFTFKPPQ